MTAHDPPPPTRPDEEDAPPSVSERQSTIGRYEVVRLIGEGAMGRVLLARDPVLGREVAVKHLRRDLKIPREVRRGLVKRMKNEARAAAHISHPNLVTLHDMGEDATLGLFLVFEYVKGPTLKQRILEGALPPADVAKLARELGDALTEAHEAGILHRDIKPENVILARTGAKLADFGIAKIPDSTLTHQGGLLGTPAYSAPETFKLATFSPESDQFSLAATVYEALSGMRAFPGDDAVAVASKIASEPPEAFAKRIGLRAEVDDALLRALERDPMKRFESCNAFANALSEALAERPVEPVAPAPEPKALPAATELPRERKLGQVALGGLVVVVTAALLVRTALRQTETEPVDPVLSATLPAPVVSLSATARPHPTVPPTHALHPRPEPSSSADVAPSASATSAPSASPAPTTSADAPKPSTDGGAKAGVPSP